MLLKVAPGLSADATWNSVAFTCTLSTAGSVFHARHSAASYVKVRAASGAAQERVGPYRPKQCLPISKSRAAYGNCCVRGRLERID